MVDIIFPALLALLWGTRVVLCDEATFSPNQGIDINIRVAVLEACSNMSVITTVHWFRMILE